MRKGKNIYHRKDGRWEYRIFRGRRPDGTRIYKSVYGRSYHEAKEKGKAEERKLCEIPLFREPCVESATFSETSVQWMAFGENRWKRSTYARYEGYLKNYLLPVFGDIPVDQISQYVYSRFFIGCQTERDLGMSVMHLIHTVFTGVMKFAARILPVNIPHYDKPAGTAAGQKREATVLDQEERNRLENRILDELGQGGEPGKRREAPGILMGILLVSHTGLRIGELCALRLDDICLDDRVITVRETLQRLPVRADSIFGDSGSSTKTELVFGTPKNGEERLVPIPPSLMPVLERYMEGRHSDGFLLSGTEKPVEPRTLRYRFKQLLKRAGVRDVCFHTLRHTFATECTEKGVEAKVVSEVLGHSGITITLQRYVHLSTEYKMERIWACGL